MYPEYISESLAVTRDNRFIPLKDGVWEPDYERSLLGADVPAIIDALSLGWYESLFQSYMATKVAVLPGFTWRSRLTEYPYTC